MTATDGTSGSTKELSYRRRRRQRLFVVSIAVAALVSLGWATMNVLVQPDSQLAETQDALDDAIRATFASKGFRVEIAIKREANDEAAKLEYEHEELFRLRQRADGTDKLVQIDSDVYQLDRSAQGNYRHSDADEFNSDPAVALLLAVQRELDRTRHEGDGFRFAVGPQGADTQGMIWVRDGRVYRIEEQGSNGAIYWFGYDESVTPVTPPPSDLITN